MASSAPYEQAWAACCDAVGCADALRAQGWQALAALQLDKDTLNEAEVSSISPHSWLLLWVQAGQRMSCVDQRYS